MDKILTYIGLSIGAVEVNPGAKFLIHNFGLFIGCLIGAILGMIFVYFITKKDYMLVFIACTFTALIIWNIIIILVVKGGVTW